MPYRQLSRHVAAASALSLVLIIAGCSSGQSTTGSALSKEATACYSEYVDLHGDIKKAYKAQLSSGIASQSEYGKAHYEGMGANEGRALPQGCGEHLQISTGCYASYVDQNADLLAAFNASGQQDKSAWGKSHYENRPAADTRALPSGCTYLAAPANPCEDKSIDDVTDAQWLYFIEQTPALSGYTPKSAKHWYCTDASGYGNASLTPPGQCPTGYTGTAPNCVEVVAVAEAASSESATQYTMRFTETAACAYGCPTGATVGDPFTIDVVVDNGASKISNTWDYAHAKSITFRAGTWSATVNPQLGTPNGQGGSFKTNASGTLTDAPSITVAAGWTQGSSAIGAGQTDSNGTTIHSWYLNRFNDIIYLLIDPSSNDSSIKYDAVGSTAPMNGVDDISKWSIL